jgi:ATP-dependent DNA helicase RecG
LGEKRLQTLKTYQDGYDIAEKDLQNRGYGNILGVKQAGKGKFRFSTWEKSLEIAPMANAIGEDIKRDYPHLIPALVNRWGKLIKDEIK